MALALAAGSLHWQLAAGTGLALVVALAVALALAAGSWQLAAGSWHWTDAGTAVGPTVIVAPCEGWGMVTAT